MANKKSLDNITSLKKEYSKLVSVKNELIQDKKFFEKDINCKVNLKELLKQKEFLEEKVIFMVRSLEILNELLKKGTFISVEQVFSMASNEISKFKGKIGYNDEDLLKETIKFQNQDSFLDYSYSVDDFDDEDYFSLDFDDDIEENISDYNSEIKKLYWDIIDLKNTYPLRYREFFENKDNYAEDEKKIIKSIHSMEKADKELNKIFMERLPDTTFILVN